MFNLQTKPMKNNNYFIIAGPCVAESEKLLMNTAEHLKKISVELDIDIIFKSSYKKANRTSVNSFTGPGDEKALSWLKKIREEFSLRVLTDFHSTEEARFASQFVDVLQVPAFLARQTELLKAAGESGLPVNIKKGQFMAPEDMFRAAEKVESTGNKEVWLTERGTFFGYHDLVVDFRSLIKMKEKGHKVIFDATHSVQKPSKGSSSGGCPEFIRPLALAAAATGIDGMFIETHPDPANALSDAASQLPLNSFRELLIKVLEINNIAKK